MGKHKPTVNNKQLQEQSAVVEIFLHEVTKAILMRICEF